MNTTTPNITAPSVRSCCTDSPARVSRLAALRTSQVTTSSTRNQAPTSHRHQLKRWLLLELVSYPPADGDALEDLTRTLEEPLSEVQAAVDELVGDGLAERDGDRVRASTAAWKFDALWPARP